MQPSTPTVTTRRPGTGSSPTSCLPRAHHRGRSRGFLMERGSGLTISLRTGVPESQIVALTGVSDHSQVCRGEVPRNGANSESGSAGPGCATSAAGRWAPRARRRWRTGRGSGRAGYLRPGSARRCVASAPAGRGPGVRSATGDYVRGRQGQRRRSFVRPAPHPHAPRLFGHSHRSTSTRDGLLGVYGSAPISRSKGRSPGDAVNENEWIAEVLGRAPTLTVTQKRALRVLLARSQTPRQDRRSLDPSCQSAEHESRQAS